MITLKQVMATQELDVFPLFAAIRKRKMGIKTCCRKQIYPWNAAIVAAERSAMIQDYTLYKKITGGQ